MDAETRLHADLDALGIGWTQVEHAAVFTVAESHAAGIGISGADTKNLFLKDARGAYYLVTAPADASVDLKALPAAIGCKRLSFGNAADMQRLIGVTPGSVTPFAVMNDADGAVTMVLSAALAAAATVTAHPLRNTATLSLAGPDLVRALAHWRHPPLVVDLPERTDP